MVGAPVRSIIPSLKLGHYLSVKVHKPCSISHILLTSVTKGLEILIKFSTLIYFVVFGLFQLSAEMAGCVSCVKSGCFR